MDHDLPHRCDGTCASSWWGRVRKPSASLNLFCFPDFAVSVTSYNAWRRMLPGWLQVRPVELPGRGMRSKEPLQIDMVSLAARLADEIASETDTPCALFGHGLGGLLIFELAHALRARGLAAPLALFVSGSAGPGCRDDSEGATEQSGSFVHGQREPLDMPVHVFGGKRHGVTIERLLDWQEHSSGSFSLDMFEGGQSYLVEQRASVLRQLRGYAEQHLRGWRGETGRDRVLAAG